VGLGLGLELGVGLGLGLELGVGLGRIRFLLCYVGYIVVLRKRCNAIKG